MKNVAGQAGGVHAGQHVLAVADLTAHHGHVGTAAQPVLEDMNGELAKLSRQLRRGDAVNRNPLTDGVD